MKFVFDAKNVSIIGGAAVVALVCAAAPAAAEPTPPPPPVPAPLPAPAPTPAAEDPAQAVTNSAAEPIVEGVPHLLSPDNLPPGTSDTPVTQSQPRRNYLRELWHAMQTQEVSAGDALLLLTQRPMVADATPPRGMPTGPQAPSREMPAGTQTPSPASLAPEDASPPSEAPAPEAPATETPPAPEAPATETPPAPEAPATETPPAPEA
ncbi:MAG: hypothetical protein ACPGVY_09145, partial [Mycobacterium sp.]